VQGRLLAGCMFSKSCESLLALTRTVYFGFWVFLVRRESSIQGREAGLWEKSGVREGKSAQ